MIKKKKKTEKTTFFRENTCDSVLDGGTPRCHLRRAQIKRYRIVGDGPQPCRATRDAGATFARRSIGRSVGVSFRLDRTKKPRRYYNDVSHTTFTFAGRPDPPRYCLPVNVTSTRFAVQCEPGYGGGLPQHFACTVRATAAASADSAETVHTGRPGRATVEVTGLRPSTQYVATVYASNAKGSSAGHVRVYVETAPNPKDPRVAGGCASVLFFRRKLYNRV